MKEVVVFVHGIWMTGDEMRLLRRRVARCGFKTRLFRYHSLLATPDDSAKKLNAYMEKLDAEVVHLVAHSLGGIVVTHLFDLFPVQKPGRVVMMGSPINGSAAAMGYYRSALTRPLLGRSIKRGLLGDGPRWKRVRELGMIAGDRGVGIGSLLFGELPRPHDGTVSVGETWSIGVDRHMRVPYSHFGMLYSRQVAKAVCQFLQKGEFEGAG